MSAENTPKTGFTRQRLKSRIGDVSENSQCNLTANNHSPNEEYIIKPDLWSFFSYVFSRNVRHRFHQTNLSIHIKVALNLCMA